MKISVFLNDNLISEVELDISKEYVAGRSRQCDIVLNHPELSRRHFSLKYINGQWECELISQYRSLRTNGNSVNRLSLTEGSSFSVSDFLFKCSETLTPSKAPEEALPLEKTFALEESHENNFDNLEKTKVAPLILKTILTRLDPFQVPVEEITLEEGTVEVGRHEDCDIVLSSSKASRKHFSLTKTNSSVILKDLNSTHGVSVNGKKISEHKLEPKDRIQVGEETFIYDEVNPVFDNLPHPMQDTNIHKVSVVKVGSRRNLKPLYITLTLLLFLAIYSKFETKKQPNRQPAESKSIDPLQKLSEQQRKFLEDTYNLSLSLYTSGKYDLAALEISKIFQLVPQYKDARNIETLCQQALEIKKQNEENERVRQDHEDLKKNVASMLSDCEKLYNQKKYHDIDECVSKISELDPENEKAMQLTQNARAKIEEIESSAEYKAELQRRTIKANKLFENGQQNFKLKRFPAAINDFSAVTKINFNDKNGIKEKSAEAIKAAKLKLKEESLVLVKEGKTALDNKDFKTAISKLSKAEQISPDNEEARQVKQRAISDLRIEMKNLYSESVIEENLGNIESAKKKWRHIIDQNLSSDSYYEKAKTKLGKYEK